MKQGGNVGLLSGISVYVKDVFPVQRLHLPAVSNYDAVEYCAIERCRGSEGNSVLQRQSSGESLRTGKLHSAESY